MARLLYFRTEPYLQDPPMNAGMFSASTSFKTCGRKWLPCTSIFLRVCLSRNGFTRDQMALKDVGALMIIILPRYSEEWENIKRVHSSNEFTLKQG